MIEVINNGNGYSAVCQYHLVDKQGQHQNKGKYLYIYDLMIAEKYQKKGIIKQIIKQFLNKYPHLRYCYFERQNKYPDEPERLKMCFHGRSYYEKLIKKGEKNETITDTALESNI